MEDFDKNSHWDLVEIPALIHFPSEFNFEKPYSGAAQNANDGLVMIILFVVMSDYWHSSALRLETGKTYEFAFSKICKTVFFTSLCAQTSRRHPPLQVDF